MDRSADENEIRRQYKRLAKLYHPDLNPEPEAAPRMRALNDAYGVLSDPQRRALYDTVTGVAWAAWEDEPATAGERAMQRYEGELDNELSVHEALARKRASLELVVRKTGYRRYEVASLDQQLWYGVSADSGCVCPDSRSVAGPFGCKHWFAMERFRNNGDRPADTRGDEVGEAAAGHF